MAVKRKEAVAWFVAIVTLLFAAFVATLCWRYLTALGDTRKVIGAFAVVIGVGLAYLFYQVVVRLCASRLLTYFVVLLVAGFVIAPPASMIYPGRITHSARGLTVYGIIPIPVLDITIGARGALWFRDKSARVFRPEIDKLLSPEVEVLIIGTGWDGTLEVDPSIKNLPIPEVHILKTPEAFELYNRLRAEQRVVVILAHSS